ncbi:MAG: arylformamidase [Kiritimatiellia bacterium]|jgi:arylformamidase
MLIDISPTLHAGIAVWPGDVPFSRSTTCAIDSGANIDLSAVHTTVHLGAHTDSPSHTASPAQDIHERALDRYYGPCQVITVHLDAGARAYPSDIAVEVSAPRVLLRTLSFPDPDAFNTDFNSYSPELVTWLYDRGVRLIGLDTPSIDPFSSELLESHHAVGERDMAILEGVMLEHVEDGVYLLIALPLKLKGADASPVRAALAPMG